jgi:phage-related protein
VYKVRFFHLSGGASPVEEFLDSLPAKHAQKVVWVLQLIEDLDQIPATYLKKLVNTDGIWEIRAQQGNNIFRLLGFIDGDAIIVLTNGFSKKTQKTPRQEIALAEQRKKEHLKKNQS